MVHEFSSICIISELTAYSGIGPWIFFYMYYFWTNCTHVFAVDRAGLQNSFFFGGLIAAEIWQNLRELPGCAAFFSILYNFVFAAQKCTYSISLFKHIGLVPKKSQIFYHNCLSQFPHGFRENILENKNTFWFLLNHYLLLSNNISF